MSTLSSIFLDVTTPAVLYASSKEKSSPLFQIKYFPKASSQSEDDISIGFKKIEYILNVFKEDKKIKRLANDIWQLLYELNHVNDLNSISYGVPQKMTIAMLAEKLAKHTNLAAFLSPCPAKIDGKKYFQEALKNVKDELRKNILTIGTSAVELQELRKKIEFVAGSEVSKGLNYSKASCMEAVFNFNRLIGQKPPYKGVQLYYRDPFKDNKNTYFYWEDESSSSIFSKTALIETIDKLCSKFRVDKYLEGGVQRTIQIDLNKYISAIDAFLCLPFGSPIKNSCQVKSGFGPRINPLTAEIEFHAGVDLAVSSKTPLYSTVNGVVIAVNFDNKAGGYIDIAVIEKDRLSLKEQRILAGENQLDVTELRGRKVDMVIIRFAHLSKSAVKPGDFIKRGELVGFSGDSGNVRPFGNGAHLHYRIMKVIKGIVYTQTPDLDPQPTIDPSSQYLTGRFKKWASENNRNW